MGPFIVIDIYILTYLVDRSVKANIFVFLHVDKVELQKLQKNDTLDTIIRVFKSNKLLTFFCCFRGPV